MISPLALTVITFIIKKDTRLPVAGNVPNGPSLTPSPLNYIVTLSPASVMRTSAYAASLNAVDESGSITRTFR